MKKAVLFSVLALICSQPVCADDAPKKVSTTRHIFNGSLGTVKVAVGGAAAYFCGYMFAFQRGRVNPSRSSKDLLPGAQGSEPWFLAGTAIGAALFVSGLRDLKQEGNAAVRAIKNRRAKAAKAA